MSWNVGKLLPLYFSHMLNAMITEEACTKHDEKRLKSTAFVCLPREVGCRHKSPPKEAGSKVLIPSWNKEDNAMFNLCLELRTAPYLSGKEGQFSLSCPGFEPRVRHLVPCVRAPSPLVWAAFPHVWAVNPSPRPIFCIVLSQSPFIVLYLVKG